MINLGAIAGESNPAREERPSLRIGAVQHRWHPDPAEHRAALAEGVRIAAAEGATLVCLQELTLSPYFAVTVDGPKVGEDVPHGPTCAFAAEVAAETGAHVHASLYERAEDGGLLSAGPAGCGCAPPDAPPRSR